MATLRKFSSKLHLSTDIESTGLLRFFSFVSQTFNPSISFDSGNQITRVYYPTGTSEAITNTTDEVLTGVNPGDLLIFKIDAPLKFGFDNVTSPAGLGDAFEIYWEAFTECTNLELKDLGVTRPILGSMTNTFLNLDLRGNSIGGDFPNGVTATNNLFLQDNKFSGGLPTFNNSMVRYQVNGNKFRGDLPDITASTSIQSFLVYNQKDTALGSNDRVMITGEIPDLSGCTSLNFYHVGAGPSWSQGFRNQLTVASDFDIPVTMSKFYASNCSLSSDEVDQILTTFAAKAGTFSNPDIIDLSGNNGNPSSTGSSAVTTLTANGWTVNVSGT
jgi:hypothetical protein